MYLVDWLAVVLSPRASDTLRPRQAGLYRMIKAIFTGWSIPMSETRLFHHERKVCMFASLNIGCTIRDWIQLPGIPSWNPLFRYGNLVETVTHTIGLFGWDMLNTGWSWMTDLNPRPDLYKRPALPTELIQHDVVMEMNTPISHKLCHEYSRWLRTQGLHCTVTGWPPPIIIFSKQRFQQLLSESELESKSVLTPTTNSM